MPDLPVPIIRSKLYPPPVVSSSIARNRLLELVPDVEHHRVTLISAPAGYGKSTLVSQWLACCTARSVWLSLDTEDSELRRFVSYLIAAVRSVVSARFKTSVKSLELPGLPDPAELAAIFTSDFEQINEPLVVVLDDYHHLASPAVHEFVDAILRRPPQGLHLVIVSRRDPPLALQNLRARGVMTEVRSAQLAFNAQETLQFLQQAMGSEMDREAIGLLHERTEGWPAGLRLALLALPLHDTGDFLARMPADLHAIRTYLVHEVLAKCPDQAKEILLRTGFLDRFCAPLCQVVCGPAQSDGAGPGMSGEEFVDWVNETGMFSIPLDAQRKWFRFHHLFQAMLQEEAAIRLPEPTIRDIHRNCASWLEGEGLLDEAIQHLLQADGPEALAALILRHRNELMNAEQWFHLDAWLRLIPPELVDRSPELLLLKARQLQTAGSIEEVQRLQVLAESLLDTVEMDESTRQHLMGSIESLRCFQLYVSSEGSAAIDSARKAIELLPPEGIAERGYAAIVLGGALQMAGEFVEAKNTLYSSTRARGSVAC